MLLADHITNKLFKRDIERVRDLTDSLIERNNEIKGINYHGFLLGNCTYWHTQARRISTKERSRTTIAFELIKESQQFQKEQILLGDHKRRIYQTITQLFEETVHPKDLVDALPNCLHMFLPDDYKEFVLSPRIHDEAWTLKIEGRERQLRQYEKILPVIHSYVAMSMM